MHTKLNALSFKCTLCFLQLHNCSRLGVRRTLLVRQKNEQALSCRPRKSAISYTPTASTMSSLQNIDFSQPIDLSDKTEKEIQVCHILSSEIFNQTYDDI